MCTVLAPIVPGPRPSYGELGADHNRDVPAAPCSRVAVPSDAIKHYLIGGELRGLETSSPRSCAREAINRQFARLFELKTNRPPTPTPFYPGSGGSVLAQVALAQVVRWLGELTTDTDLDDSQDDCDI